MHEEEVLGKAYDARLLLRLWRYVAPYRGQVLLTLLLVGPIFLFELVPAWIVKVGLDHVIAPAQHAEGATPFERLFTAPAWIAPLMWLAFLYFAAALISAALQFLHMTLMARTGQAAMRDLRQAVFGHLQRLHLRFFDRYPVGRLVTRATNDVENIAEMFSAGIVAFVTDLVKMLGFAVALFLVDAELALVTFAVVPLLAAAAVIFRLRIREAFRRVRVRIARINTYLQEAIVGMRVIQLFTRERYNHEEFDALNADHRDAWKLSIHYDAALFAVVELAAGISVAVIIGYGAGLAAAGTLYVFIDWMRRFFTPLRDLSAKYSVMQSAMASCERVFQLLDVEPQVRDPERPRAPAAPARGAVEFDGVRFAYQAGEPVLDGISFRVEPGERVALVGATGSGKTTLIKLLLRFYDVDAGSIRLDGVDLRELPQAALRRRIAMVLQDVFLFTGTIAENVALGRDDIGLEAVERAARAVEAHRFIAALPQGYAALLRERGANLSAGQRQLLSFARALVHGADVLVLDEATSSVDSETETLLQRGVHVLMQGKTAIVVAHRLSTIRDVDRILVLHGGRIVESGSHSELLARRGYYHRLYRLQYAAQEELVRKPRTVQG